MCATYLGLSKLRRRVSFPCFLLSNTAPPPHALYLFVEQTMPFWGDPEKPSSPTPSSAAAAAKGWKPLAAEKDWLLSVLPEDDAEREVEAQVKPPSKAKYVESLGSLVTLLGVCGWCGGDHTRGSKCLPNFVLCCDSRFSDGCRMEKNDQNLFEACSRQKKYINVRSCHFSSYLPRWRRIRMHLEAHRPPLAYLELLARDAPSCSDT